MPVFSSVDKIRLYWLLLVIIGDVLSAVALLFAGDNAALRLLFTYIPSPLWSAFLIMSGLLILLGWSVQGGIVASIVWSVLTIGALASNAIHAAGVSLLGPILLGWIAGFHFLITHNVASGLDAQREREQRRAREQG